jgi:hypothetical protein
VSDEIPAIIMNDRSNVEEIVSRMLDEPGEHGIYRTTRAYNELESLLAVVRAEAVGFAFGVACCYLDRGIDQRKIEMPAVMSAANEALNGPWKPGAKA